MDKSIPRLIKIQPALIEAVEQYRADHQWKSWTFALLRLVNLGLISQGREPVEPVPWGKKTTE